MAVPGGHTRVVQEASRGCAGVCDLGCDLSPDSWQGGGELGFPFLRILKCRLPGPCLASLADPSAFPSLLGNWK